MLSRNSALVRLAQRLPWATLGRWWAVGLSFFFVGLGVLYLFVDVLRLRLLLGTALAAELTVILRYGINDRWVFGERKPSWGRFWQFHVVNAGGFLIWWTITNVLTGAGAYYLLASVAGTAASVLFSMVTNFLWIWRKGGSNVSTAPSKRMVEVAHGN